MKFARQIWRKDTTVDYFTKLRIRKVLFWRFGGRREGLTGAAAPPLTLQKPLLTSPKK